MMLIEQEPRENYVIEVINTVCEHHKRMPWDTAFPGCTCGGGYSLRRATPQEREENIKRQEEEQKRRRKHIEDYDSGILS